MSILFLVGGLLCLGASAQNITLSSQCDCGFVDPSTQRVFTDSIIIYFNESATVDQSVFKTLDYTQRVQKGWNTIFRQGASPLNVGIGNNDSLPWQNALDGTAPSLEMYLNPPTWDHNSIGAELKSVRQDILYGTFRASMRSAQPWSGGSAMSMMLQYNSSESLEFDMLNKDAAPDAQLMQTINGEFPDNSLAVNYTWIQQGDLPEFPPISPWDFLDLRMDWTEKTVDFYVGKNHTRNATIEQRTIPNVPAPLIFQHWSTGDADFMMGPPSSRSVANLRWVRAFFNSSLMSEADHSVYDQKCQTMMPCSIDDVTLRGSSDYSIAATLPYHEPDLYSHIRKVAGYIAAAFSTFGIASLLNAFVRRTPWSKVKKLYLRRERTKNTQALRQSLRHSMGPQNEPALPESKAKAVGSPSTGSLSPATGWQTPAPRYETSEPSWAIPSGVATPLPTYESRRSSPWQSVTALLPRRGDATPSRTPPLSRSASLKLGSGRASSAASPAEVVKSPARALSVTEIIPAINEKIEEEDDVELARAQAFLSLEGSLDERSSKESSRNESLSEKSEDSHPALRDIKHARFSSGVVDGTPQVVDRSLPPSRAGPSEKKTDTAVVEVPPTAMMGAANVDPKKATPTQRIDYLAGFVAISCLMVTLRHFSLTFWPYVTEGQGPVAHFAADHVLSYILGPYLLTPLWIGPFFLTACRFLAQRYLKTGKLNDVGNKMLLRAPRMLLPCFVFMTLEYFFISLGLTSKLESLPSVSWSTWPYVQPQANFGVFLNEIVELAYIIPNAAPQVINNYCVGILWTIPVQLQFSFVTLFATVIIKDIKTPWKRILYYIVTIIFGWYATSWSACHWLGLMLADMDISYNWIKWTQARWWALYPVLFLATGVAFVTPLMLLFNSSFFDFPFMAWENGIHPDVLTGRPLYETVTSIYDVYPPYYYPSAGILSFSVGLQIIVELSTWVQAFLSMKVITFFHPHIMTIYLMHGFIFWSLGSYIATALAELDTPYWAILLIVAVVCYTVIFTLATMITPLIDFATKGVTKHLWRWATEVPVPHMRETAPFTKDLIVGRMVDESKSLESA